VTPSLQQPAATPLRTPASQAVGPQRLPPCRTRPLPALALALPRSARPGGAAAGSPAALVDSADGEGRRPLHYAAAMGHAAIIEQLWPK
jgi:hypothetical protein